MERQMAGTSGTTAKDMIKRGFWVGFPIMLGYLPIAITYGVLAKQAGLSLLELTSMSALVFAGASQFMAANMIAIGAGAVEIIIATLVLNFRHFVMSLSYSNHARDIGRSWKVPLSLGLTDETFAVSAIHKDEGKKAYGRYFYAALILTAYSSWVIGSLLGGLLGEVIPPRLSESMGIALYAMFIGLLIPSVKKELKVGLIALFAMLLNYLFGLYLSEGWSIVLATVISGFSGVFLLKEDQS
ncbi:putative membrane protein [Lentibacillus sp. JNUCC-1]|uniref:AzlC family ABC transporter permease n=1 Tax=Lentibacillus sp. JNUCC-1 TaxID=2654513 RepID=UPI001326521C|nr:AzlC family ABC transporter permease [Lentibacillus sp. JNUCC-1]MUV36643.1 putative membrane protein [Lentibacillus sp. JNUCC-1]